MTISSPDGGWGNYYGDLYSGNFASAGFRDGAYVSLDNGLTWTTNSFPITEAPKDPFTGANETKAHIQNFLDSFSNKSLTVAGRKPFHVVEWADKYPN